MRNKEKKFKNMIKNKKSFKINYFKLNLNFNSR